VLCTAHLCFCSLKLAIYCNFSLTMAMLLANSQQLLRSQMAAAHQSAIASVRNDSSTAARIRVSALTILNCEHCPAFTLTNGADGMGAGG
jgi:hypothetical protein